MRHFRRACRRRSTSTSAQRYIIADTHERQRHRILQIAPSAQLRFAAAKALWSRSGSAAMGLRNLRTPAAAACTISLFLLLYPWYTLFHNRREGACSRELVLLNSPGLRADSLS
jgi:hypothetical protein